MNMHQACQVGPRIRRGIPRFNTHDLRLAKGREMVASLAVQKLA